jgi:hypothetical protein
LAELGGERAERNQAQQKRHTYHHTKPDSQGWPENRGGLGSACHVKRYSAHAGLSTYTERKNFGCQEERRAKRDVACSLVRFNGSIVEVAA